MKTLLFLTGLSGSGKGYFKEHFLPDGLFYPLISMTTRPIRDGEIDGVHYFFKTEKDFEQTDFVTYLDVNKNVRKPGDPKWLYGVPVDEFMTHRNQNLIYDVIQPMYIRQMIDWCNKNKLPFDFKVLYFIQPEKGFNIAAERAGMKNDLEVRRQNTAGYDDFRAAGVKIDWEIMNSAERIIFNKNMIDYINALSVKEDKGKMTIPPIAEIVKQKNAV